MRGFLIETLKLLEKEIPPPPHCHHAIQSAQYGNDESGWTDQLALQVNRDGSFTCLFLDDEDFQKTPEVLVGEMVAILLG